MKKSILFILSVIAILFNSCDIVYFEKPIPVSNSKMKKFPQKIRGVFVSNEDTLRISEHSFKFNDKQNSIVIKGDLTKDNCVLKKYKRYYIINIKDSVYWTAFASNFRNDSLFIFMPEINNSKNKGDDEEKYKKELSSDFGIKEFKLKNDKYIFISNPNDKQLKKMFEKGIFINVYKFAKITTK